MNNQTTQAPTLLSKKVLSEIKDIMQRNGRRYGNYLYTVPSPETYPYQWMWDSCFHAIIYSHIDVAKGKAEILSLLSKQFKNGMVPHMIYWKRGKGFVDINWGQGRRTSNITQPPMIAYAAWCLFQEDQDVEFLRSIYPNLFHYYKYLINERDPHARGLIGVINPDETGEDNSPRFDAVLDLPPVHTMDENFKKRLNLVAENIKCKFDAPFCMKNFFWVKDVPFNSIMVENLRCLSMIAEKLEREDDAVYFTKIQNQIIKSMREMMFEDGLYWSTYGESYQKIKVKTWAIFSPMFAKIISKEEADELVSKHLLNEKEFWSNYPVPTVSMDEASYDPHGMWRGPNWASVNWFIFKGLMNYGFNDIAESIKNTSLKLIEKSGFREQYDPHSGEGYGAQNFTWPGLIIDME